MLNMQRKIIKLSENIFLEQSLESKNIIVELTKVLRGRDEENQNIVFKVSQN